MSSFWSWKLIRAGAFRLDGGGLFGLVPKALWSKMMEPDEKNRIDLQSNCLLLERDGVKVLVESGLGDKWNEKQRLIYHMEPRTILDGLREVGCDPEEVDHIILTHLHFDHAAGLTRFNQNGEAVSNFPNAKIHLHRIEWEDAQAGKTTMKGNYLPTHLEPIAAQVRLLDGEAQILPGLEVWPMVGHTWGQQAVRFDDGSGIVAFCGDVMPTVHHLPLTYNMAYDMLPYSNMLSKKRLLETAAAKRWRLVLAHEPGDPVVEVVVEPGHADGFRLLCPSTKDNP